jgi:molybdopterin synthase catalytic subunit
MAWTEISPHPIDPALMPQRIDQAGCGALVTFSGAVRNASRGRDVLYLDYEAYLTLAEAELKRLVEEAEVKFGVRAAVQHRIGRVYPGESSILVAAASPHRAAAFDACRWIMDTIKTTVPIWKREHHAEGADWIEGDSAVPAIILRPIS